MARNKPKLRTRLVTSSSRKPHTRARTKNAITSKALTGDKMKSVPYEREKKEKIRLKAQMKKKRCVKQEQVEKETDNVLQDAAVTDKNAEMSGKSRARARAVKKNPITDQAQTGDEKKSVPGEIEKTKGIQFNDQIKEKRCVNNEQLKKETDNALQDAAVTDKNAETSNELLAEKSDVDNAIDDKVKNTDKKNNAKEKRKKKRTRFYGQKKKKRCVKEEQLEKETDNVLQDAAVTDKIAEIKEKVTSVYDEETDEYSLSKELFEYMTNDATSDATKREKSEEMKIPTTKVFDQEKEQCSLNEEQLKIPTTKVFDQEKEQCSLNEEQLKKVTSDATVDDAVGDGSEQKGNNLLAEKNADTDATIKDQDECNHKVITFDKGCQSSFMNGLFALETDQDETSDDDEIRNVKVKRRKKRARISSQKKKLLEEQLQEVTNRTTLGAAVDENGKKCLDSHVRGRLVLDQTSSDDEVKNEKVKRKKRRTRTHVPNKKPRCSNKKPRCSKKKFEKMRKSAVLDAPEGDESPEKLHVEISTVLDDIIVDVVKCDEKRKGVEEEKSRYFDEIDTVLTDFDSYSTSSDDHMLDAKDKVKEKTTRVSGQENQNEKQLKKETFDAALNATEKDEIGKKDNKPEDVKPGPSEPHPNEPGPSNAGPSKLVFQNIGPFENSDDDAPPAKCNQQELIISFPENISYFTATEGDPRLQQDDGKVKVVCTPCKKCNRTSEVKILGPKEVTEKLDFSYLKANRSNKGTQTDMISYLHFPKEARDRSNNTDDTKKTNWVPGSSTSDTELDSDAVRRFERETNYKVKYHPISDTEIVVTEEQKRVNAANKARYESDSSVSGLDKCDTDLKLKKSERCNTPNDINTPEDSASPPPPSRFYVPISDTEFGHDGFPSDYSAKSVHYVLTKCNCSDCNSGPSE